MIAGFPPFKIKRLSIIGPRIRHQAGADKSPENAGLKELRASIDT